jgi:hypothetical protein
MDPNIARFHQVTAKSIRKVTRASSSIPSDPKELNLTRELQKDLESLRNHHLNQ